MTSSLPEIRAITGNRYVRRLIRGMARQSLSAIYLLSWSVTAAAAFYGATIIFGLASGYALPPAAVFALIPGAHRISDFEPFLPWPLLGVAAIGASCGWTAAAGMLPVADLHKQERRLLRFCRENGIAVTGFSRAQGSWLALRCRSASTSSPKAGEVCRRLG